MSSPSMPTELPQVGIICMEKKSSAKPMRSILRLIEQVIGQYAEFVVFTDEQLLNEPIESWPPIFAALAFYSTGFPINKVMSYARLERVTVINGTLELQKRLFNRGCVKELLDRHNIPECPYIAVHRKRLFCVNCTPIQSYLHAHLDNSGGGPHCWCELPVFQTVDEPSLTQNCALCVYQDPVGFIEGDYFVENAGTRIHRPFVEKPIDADDHNVYIYFSNYVIKLFRKIENKSSERIEGYFPVRHDGCYVYEQFLDAGGKDLKVYAIYPNYALAEVRKSPHIDGIVERDELTNKEKREQTILNDDERLMVNTVSMAFMQLICGLDILRTTEGISYIMDVNGFSFVKGNEFYDEECSESISTIIIEELERRRRSTFKALTLFPEHEKYATESELLNKYIDKLNSVMQSTHYDKYLNDNILRQKSLISIFRHGDRSPKFKYVFYTQIKELINIFYKSDTEDAPLEFRIRPEFQPERASEIAADLRQFLEGCSVNESSVQRHKLYQYIEVPDIIHKSISMLTGNRIVSEDEANGLKLIVYMIINQLAGSKVEIKEIMQRGIKQFKIIVKWGGYLTISGLRESFMAGRETKEKYIKDIKNAHINVKVFHTSERRITRTAEAVLLGFLADSDVEIEDILPILNTTPFNQSDCICPNIFDILEQEWGGEEIPHLDSSVEQLRNYLQEDDESLNVQSQSLKLRKEEDLRMVSRLLNSDNLEYKSPYEISIERAFQSCLTDLNEEFDNDGFIHKQYFELIVSCFERIMEQLHNDRTILLHSYVTACNETESICMTEFISFVLLEFVEFDEEGNISYNVSKLTDIYELLLFLIIHHNRLMKELPDFKQLFVIAHKYNKSLARIMYGYSEFNTVQYGEKIAGNLLRSIQDDIEMSYNYYRKIDVENLISRKHLLRFSTDEDSQLLSRRESVTSDNVAVRLAQQLTEHDGAIDLPVIPTYEKIKKDKRQMRFYVTDDAHIYSLYHLLSNTQMEELSEFCVLSSGGLGVVNYMAELHFIYYELFSTEYYTDEIQKIDISKPLEEILKETDLPGPSRLVEISFSKGESSDAWEPVPNNVLPIDSPELIYSMFPLSNINMLNTKIERHGQFKNAYQLVTVIAVYRHGDRQPKEKLKISVSNAGIVSQIMDMFELNPSKPDDVSMSSDKNLEYLSEQLPKLHNIFKERSVSLSSSDISSLDTFFKICLTFPPAMKFQIKFPVPYKGEKKCTLIVKYGGILTTLGVRQSELAASYLVNELEEDFSTGSADAAALLHKIEIFTNDELRVKATAEAFCDTFCQAFKLKETPPKELQILCQTDQRARVLMDKEKKILNAALTLNVELCNTPVKSLPDAAERVVRELDAFKIEDLGNPLERLLEIKRLMTEIAYAYASPDIELGKTDCDKSEVMEPSAATLLKIARYQASLEEFAQDSSFNVSKIGDVYDMLRYEAYQANETLPQEIHTKLRRAYELSRLLCKFSIPLQFGTSEFNRKIICGLISQELVKHIVKQADKPGISLYFVSESHIHALAKIIRIFLEQDEQIWVNFMCHLIIKLYKCGEEQRIEISFSQGSFENPFKDEFGSPRVQEPILLSDNLQGDTLNSIYQEILKITSSEAFGKRFNLGYEVIEE